MSSNQSPSDEQLKTVAGIGLLAWIVLSFAQVPAVGGLGAVAAAVAGVMLLVRKRK